MFSFTMQIFLFAIATIFMVTTNPIPQEVVGDWISPTLAENPAKKLGLPASINALNDVASSNEETVEGLDISITPSDNAIKLESGESFSSGQPPSCEEENSLNEAKTNPPVPIDATQKNKAQKHPKPPPYCPGVLEPLCCQGIEFGSGLRGKCKACMSSFHAMISTWTKSTKFIRENRAKPFYCSKLIAE